MPLVRIALRAGKTPEYRRSIGDGIHRAMVDALGIPPDDRFQIFSEHDADSLIADPQYLGIARSGDAVMVQITLRRGRTVEQKRDLYQRITLYLAEAPGVRPEDILVVLSENSSEDWSFGGGLAQYAPAAEPTS